MKIFITGATSSIGLYLVKFLLEEGNTLNLLVRKNKSHLFLDNPKINLFLGDLNDIDILRSAMKDCDQVYHLAAIAKVWLKDPNKFFNVNLNGTINILNIASETKVKKIVITSTAGTYGPSLNGVINENKIRELDFFNEYESSKALSELKVKEFVIEKNMDIIIVSPTRVYGPLLDGKPNSTNLLIDKFLNGFWRFLPGSGTEIGNYVYIEDVAKGHILAMKYGERGQTYILGGENCSYIKFFQLLKNYSGIKRRMIRMPFTIQKVFAIIQLFLAEKLGMEPNITPKWLAKGVYNWEVSSHKAITKLNYKVTPLEKGIKETVLYFQKHEKC